MKKNPHPRCGCKACRAGASTEWGKFVHRAVNRKIRHATRIELSKKGADFDMVIISTPMTD